MASLIHSLIDLVLVNKLVNHSHHNCKHLTGFHPKHPSPLACLFHTLPFAFPRHPHAVFHLPPPLIAVISQPYNRYRHVLIFALALGDHTFAHFQTRYIPRADRMRFHKPPSFFRPRRTGSSPTACTSSFCAFSTGHPSTRRCLVANA